MTDRLYLAHRYFDLDDRQYLEWFVQNARYPNPVQMLVDNDSLVVLLNTNDPARTHRLIMIIEILLEREVLEQAFQPDPLIHIHLLCVEAPLRRWIKGILMQAYYGEEVPHLPPNYDTVLTILKFI